MIRMASFVVSAAPREPSDTAEPCDLGAIVGVAPMRLLPELDELTLRVCVS